MKTISNLKISHRLLISISIIAVLYAGNLIFNYSNISVLTENVESIYKNRLLSISSLLEADRDGYQSRLEMAEIIIAFKENSSPNPEVLNNKTSSMIENLDQIDERYKKFKNLFSSSGSTIQNDIFQKFENSYQKVRQHTFSIEKAINSRNLASLENLYFNEYIAQYELMRGTIDELTNISYEYTEKEYITSIEKAENVKSSTLWFFIATMTMLFVLGYLLTQSIINQLGCEPKEAAAIAKNLSEGKLYFDIEKKTKKGLFLSLSNTVEKLRDLIQETKATTNQVDQAAVQLTSVSQNVSNLTSDQAASAEEVSASLEEITASVDQNTANAQKARSISLKAVEGIEKGNREVNHTLEGMRKVAEKIKVIDEIVKRTDILALNAAVEAARAGTYGRGFAVVATEIRKLAERTKEEASQINEITEMGLSIADTSKQQLSQVIPDIHETASLIDSNTNSFAEQSASIQQINSAIQQLNQNIQQNASNSQELASSSVQMKHQTGSLREMINFFKLEKTTAEGKEVKLSQPNAEQLKKVS